MKKTKLNSKLIIIMFIILNFINVISYKINSTATNDIHSLQKHFNFIENKDNFKEYYKHNIELNTNIEKQRSIVLTNLYQAQPFLSYLEIQIKIIDKNEMIKISEKNKIDTFKGSYNKEKKEITIVGYDSDTSIHEVGHAVYHQLLGNKDKLLVNDYYKLESKNLIDVYGNTNVEEFFAVAFTEYIYSNKTLCKNCPKINGLILELQNKLK